MCRMHSNFVVLAVAAAAILALGPQSAGAGLISLYTFDNNADNSIGGAPNGTLVGDTGYVTGAVGTKAVDFDGAGDCVNTSTSGYPKGNGLWEGTIAFWMKSTSCTTTSAMMFAAYNSDPDKTGFDIRDRITTVGADTMHLGLVVREKGGSSLFCGINRGADDEDLYNGEWHHVLVTWDTTTGASGTGDARFYVDGERRTTISSTNTIDSADTFSNWAYPVRIGSGNRDTVANEYDGSMDDVGVWSNRLTGTQARALYSLGTDVVLDYNAKDAQTLFDIFYTLGPGGEGITSDGKTWRYVTGLSGDASGTVVNNHTALLMDGSGNGVQIVPEPGTLALLAMGLWGLMAYAWRKRK